MVSFPMFRRETGNGANFPPLNKKIAVFPISVFPLSPGGEKVRLNGQEGGKKRKRRGKSHLVVVGAWRRKRGAKFLKI